MNVEILEFTCSLQNNETSIVLRVKKTNGKTVSEICKEVIKHFGDIVKILDDAECPTKLGNGDDTMVISVKDAIGEAVSLNGERFFYKNDGGVR